jgi:putative zincin peptidase
VLIPGFLISLITFPGVIVHELAHVIFCRLTGTKILKVCYFQLGNPTRYVIHGAPSSEWRHILVAVGPFFINSLVGLGLGIVALPFGFDLSHPGVGGWLWLWLSISIAMHAFPSTGDAKNIWRFIWRKGAPILPRLVATPIVAIIYAGALGSIFWLNAAYGYVVVSAGSKFVRQVDGPWNPWSYPVKLGDTREEVRRALAPPSYTVNQGAGDAYPRSGVAVLYEHGRVSNLTFTSVPTATWKPTGATILDGIRPTMTLPQLKDLLGDPSTTYRDGLMIYFWRRSPYLIRADYDGQHPNPGQVSDLQIMRDPR